jgi:hypothetical protein
MTTEDGVLLLSRSHRSVFIYTLNDYSAPTFWPSIIGPVAVLTIIGSTLTASEVQLSQRGATISKMPGYVHELGAYCDS